MPSLMILIIKHIEIEGPGTLGEFFKATDYKSKIAELYNGEALPSLAECEAIISLGGPMNVYEEDKYPFLKDEDNFLKKAIKEEIPILGICLGAQLLAKACGAKVTKAAQKEIGWCGVELTQTGKSDRLFAGLPHKLSIFQWHEDTFALPESAAHLAQSKVCPNQAFRFGKNAYALQFHVEVTPDMIGSWVKAYAPKESWVIDTQKMLIEAGKKKAAFERQANLIYLNFIRMIKAA